MIWLYVIIFAVSCLILYWSSSRLVKSLIKIAKFLGWREFVVAFFIMAVAGSFPNLFLGISSAVRGIPELSFGDIVGGNIIDLTLAVALAVLIGGVNLPAKSKMVQSSAVFTVVIAVLPLVLIIDGVLGRGDGLILFFVFIFYIFWLFSKSERFKKVYTKQNEEQKKEKNKITFKSFLKNIGRILFALALLLLASQGIVISAQVFSEALSFTLPLFGILIVALGNASPEIYFAIISARKKKTWFILGDLMGSIIIAASFVLGIVAIICPIEVDFSPFAIARIFLFLSALFFFITVRSDKKINKKEGIVLLLIYISFVVAEVFFK
jgi:cation:H+ antiporter